MRLEIGAIVRTLDGKDVGKVFKAIIDPKENKVTHVVIEPGSFFGRTVVVPSSAIRKANKHKLWLGVSSKELAQMPEIARTEYAAPPRGWLPPFGYQPGAILWPGGYLSSPVVVEQEENIPEGSLVINKGTEVFALDGRVGVVKEVVMSAEVKCVAGFKVAKGGDLPRTVFVPISRVTAAGGGRLSLSLTKAQLLDGE